MRTKKQWDVLVERARKMILKGETVLNICALLNVSRMMLYRESIRRGVFFSKIKPKTRIWPPDIKRFSYIQRYGVNINDLNLEQRRHFFYFKVKLDDKRRQARARGISFNIRYSDLDFPVLCPILGIPLKYDYITLSDNSATLDRLNPNKGYVRGNVYIVSWRANRIKNDGSAEEHLKIYKFIKKESAK